MQRASRKYFWIQSTIFGSAKKSTFPKTFLPILDVFFTSVFTPQLLSHLLWEGFKKVPKSKPKGPSPLTPPPLPPEK